jgi:hypothetical protein
MKHFEKNPRKISEQQAADLLYNLEVYGDLSGIVENKRTGEAIGGNQRSEVMRLIQDKVKPVIEHRYKRKTKQGTFATGYFLWQGERYSYRLVDWDAKKAQAANVIANHAGGEWDWSILQETLSKEDLLSYGFTQKELSEEGLISIDDTKITERKKEIIPKKYLHVLVSVDIKNQESIFEVKDAILRIDKIPGIEVLYGGN